MTKSIKKFYKLFLLFLIVFQVSCNSNDNKRKFNFFKKKETKFQTIKYKKKSFPKPLLDSFYRYFSNDFHGVVVLRNGDYYYEKAFGFKDYYKTQKMNENDVFQLASVSKTITATAIFILEQKKLLNLDDLVSKHLKSFPYKNVTIKNLLNHRSGLPHYMYYTDTFWKDTSRMMNNGDLYHFFTSIKPEVNSVPDYGFAYNNSNFALLATLVDSISNQSFPAFVEENIFKPCGMKNSFFIGQKPNRIKQIPLIGRMEKVEYDPNYYLNGILGDKSLTCSANDLFLFHLALCNKKILNEKNMKLIQTSTFDDEKFNVFGGSYSYGFRLKKINDKTYTFHNGWWKGFYTHFWNDFKNNINMVILANNRKSSHIDEIKIMNWLSSLPNN